ncbi:probable RNA-binding protein 19 [Nephila pilipes]|uniref:Probable RNA-binding protein 19 n=1 Tax=Nephila pilipes TaxID=299642 RepID=A0A8X6U484_NEPPI|nr:probable RNA-binding protein 19 [Nephila pilipes]
MNKRTPLQSPFSSLTEWMSSQLDGKTSILSSDARLPSRKDQTKSNNMSRLIVKNLPKTITAKKLEELFSSKGTITDLKLKYTKEGVFRQFCFIGYKTEEEANAAKDYFNNTFVYTSKIQVEKCANLGDPNKPKSWKKRIAEAKALKLEIEEKAKEKEDKSKKKKKYDDIPEELLKDAQFKEFLEINKGRANKPVWVEDVDGEPEAGVISEDEGSSSDSDYDLNYKKQVVKDKSSDNEELLNTKNKKNIRNSQIKNTVKKDESDNKLPVKLQIKDTVKKDESDNKSPVKLKKTIDDSFSVKISNLSLKCNNKQIKEFFQNLKVTKLHRAPKFQRYAHVTFETEKDMKKALNRDKGFLDGCRVHITKCVKKFHESLKIKDEEQVEISKEKNEELLADTGRIFIRNLSYTVTENDIEQLFGKYGPLSENFVPIDTLTKKAQGIAFVSYVFAEHAVKAFIELDFSEFQGRVLHLCPADPKKEYQIDENDTNFKKKKEAKLKQMGGSSHNWNILFLGMNAVADVIAEKYNVQKSKLLSGDSKESVAVRMALAETEMVMESRKFLVNNGVQLDAFSQPAAERSKTVIVVKHLPAKTTAEELNEMFSKFGTISRVILPPSGLVALVEFEIATEAMKAFRRLAYSRFHNIPLYLEWAPVDALKEPLHETTLDSTEERVEPSLKEENIKEDKEETNIKSETSYPESEEPEPGTTIFVKNINFDTTQEALEKHFKQCGSVHYASISTKIDSKTGKLLSLGFGFVQFKKKESAVYAIQNLQSSKLDGHALELKFAKRDLKSNSFNPRKKYEVKKQTSAKILVRNIPFQASEKEVKDLFSQLGLLKSVRLPKKLDGSGEHRGFGFVEYRTKDNAERAFNALCHSTHFYGRRLVLEWANPDSENVEELRKRTAKGFVDGEPRKQMKKKKLNDDLALSAAKHGFDDDD